MSTHRSRSLFSRQSLVALAVPLVLVASLVGRGLGSADGAPSASYTPIREAVLRGADQDFAEGTGIGGPFFRSCFEDRLRGALDRPTIDRLIAIYRRRGPSFAAQELNRVGAPLAAHCGRRPWVPELIHAAAGLRLAGRGTAGPLLRVTYGPYLGIRCHAAGHRGCDMVGIDVVLDRRASRVEAIVGDRRARLRTPGENSGVVHHDWVGTFAHAGLGKPDSPFRFHAPGSVHVRVEVRAVFTDGTSARAIFRHVLLAPGWG